MTKKADFKVTWFEDYCISVLHTPGTRISLRDIEEGNMFFVWGFLMDPYFIFKLTGRYIPCAPACIRGYKRIPVRSGKKKGYVLKRSPRSVVQGVVLLRMKKRDIEALDEFEEVPRVMVRKRIMVEVGDFKRRANIYMLSPRRH